MVAPSSSQSNDDCDKSRVSTKQPQTQIASNAYCLFSTTMWNMAFLNTSLCAPDCFDCIVHTRDPPTQAVFRERSADGRHVSRLLVELCHAPVAQRCDRGCRCRVCACECHVFRVGAARVAAVPDGHRPKHCARGAFFVLPRLFCDRVIPVQEPARIIFTFRLHFLLLSPPLVHAAPADRAERPLRVRVRLLGFGSRRRHELWSRLCFRLCVVRRRTALGDGQRTHQGMSYEMEAMIATDSRQEQSSSITDFLQNSNTKF